MGLNTTVIYFTDGNQNNVKEVNCRKSDKRADAEPGYSNLIFGENVYKWNLTLDNISEENDLQMQDKLKECLLRE